MPAQSIPSSEDRTSIRLKAWVARLNLIHFRRQLDLATSARHRSLLKELIADQQEHLEQIEQQHLPRTAALE